MDEILLVEYRVVGTFRLTVSSEGAALAEDVTVRSITDTRVVFTPGKRFKQLLDTVEFERGTVAQQS
jgi:hypothetical protein